MRLQTFLCESISRQQLKTLETILDRLYATLSIDVEFTKHFFDRVNDTRNKRDISIGELQELFSKAYVRYAKDFLKYSDGMEAVLADLQTDINVPFVLKWNGRSQMIELVNKTVMRKKNFKTSNRRFKL
jgi:hypothetical protein